MRQAFAICVLSLLACSALCALPGINLAVKHETFELAKFQLLPKLLSKIQGTKLPDKTVTYKSYFEATFSNIVIQDFQLEADDVDLQFIEENVGEFIIEGMNLTLTFDYNYRLLFTNGTGTGNYKLGGVILELPMEVVRDGGFFTLRMTSANAKVLSVSTHFDGEGVVPALINYLSEKLQSILNPISRMGLMIAAIEVLQPAIDGVLENVNVMKTYDDGAITFDYSLMREAFTIDRYEMGLKGQFYETDLPIEPQPVSDPFYMPWYDENLGAVQFFLSPYTFNTGFYTFWKLGHLKFTLTDSMLPKRFPLRLNTHDLDTVFPGLKTAYGDNIPCTVTAYPSTYPQLDVSNGKITFTFNGGLLINVMEKADVPTTAVDVGSDFTFNVTATTKDGKIFPKFTSVSLTGVKINKTGIPGLSSTTVNANLQALTNDIVNAVNEHVFASGLDLPAIHGIPMSDSSFTVHDSYAVVSGTPDIPRIADSLADVVVAVIEKHFHGALDTVFRQ